MPSADAAAPRLPPVALSGGLAAAGFFTWTFFSLLPALMHRGEAFRIREAWDTDAFWIAGVPFLLLAQAIAGAMPGARIFRDPLATLGGVFAGMLLVHPAGNDLGLLPLAIVFVGVPGYAGLLAAAAVGSGVGKVMR